MNALSVIQAQKRVAVDLLHLNIVVRGLCFVNLPGIILERLTREERGDQDKHYRHPNELEHFALAGIFCQPEERDNQQEQTKQKECEARSNRWDGDQRWDECPDE